MTFESASTWRKAFCGLPSKRDSGYCCRTLAIGRWVDVSICRRAEEAEEAEEEIFVVVEQMPELIGGIAALQKEIRSPEMARQAGVNGRVFVQFIVDEMGNVSNPVVLRGIGGGCDEEALRVIKKAKFKPGMQRGKAVKVRYVIPIVFKLR